jgi:hypothetical protein
MCNLLYNLQVTILPTADTDYRFRSPKLVMMLQPTQALMTQPTPSTYNMWTRKKKNLLHD